MRPLLVVGAVVVAAVAVWNAAYFFPTTVDDAFISLRYAWNLAHGQGLTFNPGERVEGFSNPTWTVLAAGFFAAGLEALAALKWTGIACAALTAVTTLRLARLAGLSPAWALLPAAMVATDINVAFWAPNGLETPFWTLLLTLFVAQLSARWTTGEKLPWSGLLAVLLYASRPEAPLFIAAAAGGEILVRRRGALPWILGVGAGCLALLLARRGYYGDWVANTWYVKAADGWRLESFPGYLGSWLGVSSPATGALLVLGAPLAARDRRTWPVLGALAVQFVFVARAGGDWMAQNRFWVPAVPLASVIVAVGVADATALAVGRWRPVMAGLPLVLLSVQAWQHVTSELRYTHPDQHRAFTQKRWPNGRKPLSTRWQGSYQTGVPDRVVKVLTTVPEGASIAHSEVGLLAFVMENPIVDGFALCDRRLSGATGEPLADVLASYEADPPDYLLMRTQVPILDKMTKTAWYTARGYHKVATWGNVWLEAPASVPDPAPPLAPEIAWARLSEAIRRVPREYAFHKARLDVAKELGPEKVAEACAELAADLPTMAGACGGGTGPAAAPSAPAADRPRPASQTPNLGFEVVTDGRPADWTSVPFDAKDWGIVADAASGAAAVEVRGALWVCSPWAPLQGDLTVWGKVKATGVPAGANERQGAAVSLRLRRADGTQSFPTLQAWTGTTPWTDFAVTFPGDPSFTDFRACVGINGTTGTATFDDVAAGSG